MKSLKSDLTTAFVVGGVGAFHLWRSRHVKHARLMLGMAMIMAVFVSPMQLVLGDLHGLNTFKHQPAKVAAMEGLWETQRGAPLKLFGWPDQELETTRFSLEIPKLSSLILTHDLNGEVRGLKAWPKAMALVCGPFVLRRHGNHASRLPGARNRRIPIRGKR